MKIAHTITMLILVNAAVMYCTSHPALALQDYSNLSTDFTACECVIFRVDDIHDNFHDMAQVEIMNVFLTQNRSLSLEIIMNNTGKDQLIIDKINEGKQKGLFELGIHGWRHEDYSRLSLLDQQETMIAAKKKMQDLFHQNATLFIPPYDKFNDNTVSALKLAHLQILSSSTEEDSNASNYFKAKGEGRTNEANPVYHLPEVTPFAYLNDTGGSIKIPFDTIDGIVQKNIKQYGYAVILLHPQNFITIKGVGNNDSIDYDAIQSLGKLVQFLSSRYQISTFEKVVKSEPQLYTLDSHIDGKSYSIVGLSNQIKLISFAIEPNRFIKINIEGQGKLQLIMPKSLIGKIVSFQGSSGQLISFTETVLDNSTESVILEVPPESTSIQVNGTAVVPEFEQWEIIGLGLPSSFILIQVFVMYRKHLLSDKNTSHL